jgi:hypothetical protein
VSSQNDSDNDRSLLESFLSKQVASQLDNQENSINSRNSNNNRVHLGHTQGGSGNYIHTGSYDSHSEGYIHENISNKKQRSSNTVEIDSDYLVHLKKAEEKLVTVENVYKEKLVAIENKLGLYKEKLVAVENELGLYKAKLGECKTTILHKNERVHDLLSTRFEKAEIIETIIDELSINAVQLAKIHGDKPLEFYSVRQMNSTYKTFINECTGPLLELINRICIISINKAPEYGINSINQPTSGQQEKCISNIFAALLEYINPLKFKHPVATGIHQYLRNITGSAEVADIFGKTVPGSWSGNNQIHNLQVYIHT